MIGFVTFLAIGTASMADDKRHSGFTGRISSAMCKIPSGARQIPSAILQIFPQRGGRVGPPFGEFVRAISGMAAAPHPATAKPAGFSLSSGNLVLVPACLPAPLSGAR
jgi:hypothetical protein